MKRWNFTDMLAVSKKLFAKIHKRKFHAHHNHNIHFMAREIDEWIPQGIKSLIEGSYSPRLLKRYYFSDERVDQLHVSDRIFQHVLLKQLKLLLIRGFLPVEILQLVKLEKSLKKLPITKRAGFILRPECFKL